MNIHQHIIILLIFVSSSCQENNIIDTSTTNSRDYLFAENIFNYIGRIVEDAFIDNGENKSCPSYSLINTDTTDIDTIIVNFGDGSPDDCLAYGKEVRGKIIITFTGKYRDSLSIISTTFDDYFINNNRIQGLRVQTNNGRNLDGKMNFTIEIIESSINGNGTIHYESMRNRVWETGYNTPLNPNDDSYSVSGLTKGNSSFGQAFETNIIEDLLLDFNCLSEERCLITSGNVELNLVGFSPRNINYGDSTCDCNYNINLDGEKYFIVVN